MLYLYSSILLYMYYTSIGFCEVDIRINLPEKVIFTEATRQR